MIVKNVIVLSTDVASTLIDEPSIITYVSTFFQHCPTTDEVNISFFVPSWLRIFSISIHSLHEQQPSYG